MHPNLIFLCIRRIPTFKSVYPVCTPIFKRVYPMCIPPSYQIFSPFLRLLCAKMCAPDTGCKEVFLRATAVGMHNR